MPHPLIFSVTVWIWVFDGQWRLGAILWTQGKKKSLYQGLTTCTALRSVLWNTLDDKRPQHSSVQSLSHVQLLATPCTTAHQASLSVTNSRVYSNSCPLIRWCHPTISSSVIPFSSHLQSFPASGSFKWVSSSLQVAKVLELQLQHQSFQWIFRTDLL